MVLRTARRVLLSCAAAALVLGSSAAMAGSRAVILNNDSQLRVFKVMKTPVVMGEDGKLKPAIIKESRGKPTVVPDFLSPMPDAKWREPEFDDSSWLKAMAPVETQRGTATGGKRAALHSASKNAMICCRYYFRAANPGSVRDLKLSLEYVGGVVVYVNGTEVARKDLPKGDLDAGSLAEKYPDDLYVEAGNNYLQNVKDNPTGFARRYRKLADVAIPGKLLRKGVNVLALQLHRAPVNEGATNVKIKAYSGMRRVPGLWAYVGLKEIELSASPGSSVAVNTGRPSGVQVWPCEVSDSITAFDYGNPAEPDRPISIVAARNGIYVGRFVISSGSEIRGLKASVSAMALDGGGEKLSGEALELRYARPVKRSESWLLEYRYDGLLPGVPATVPVRSVKPRQESHLERKFTRACSKGGAVVPVWLTVKVPKDAKPGKYTGSVSVSAQGLGEKKLPVELEVFGWTLPSPKNFRMKHTNTFSPDSIAMYYKVPYWSDRHMELMGKSMKLMAEVGARQVIVHMARYTQSRDKFNCRDSMVRWKKHNGSYEYDFSALEKYLDLVEKTMGSPRPLRINCWTEARKKTGTWDRPCPVSLLDPATGKVTALDQPAPGGEACLKFWKPVLTELRKRIEKRGWWDVTTVGHSSYCYNPNPGLVDVVGRIWPDARWSYTAHNGKLGGAFKGKEKTMPRAVTVCVWTEGKMTPRGYRELLKPGREKLIWNSVCRNRHIDYGSARNPYRSSVRCIYRLPEEMLLRGHDGLGYLSSELFPIENPKRRGRYDRVTINAGGVAGMSTKSLLAPGKDGPIPTERYEGFRQSVQECEAILYLQGALEAKSISGALAKKIDSYLQIRGEAFLKGISAGQAGNRELLRLAAEVAKATGK